jgi:transcriptional regulator with XRE-family HTH domain
MVLLRRVIGDALRSRRQGQHRTLREVSTAANVSLGYLSEIERGQKEASSELLAAICEALGAQLSELLREASDTVALAEQMADVLVPVGSDGSHVAGVTGRRPDDRAATAQRPIRRPAPEHAQRHRTAGQRTAREAAEPRVGADAMAGETVRKVATDGTVSVSVRQETPLKATLRATRTVRRGDRGRDVVFAA